MSGTVHLPSLRHEKEDSGVVRSNLEGPKISRGKNVIVAHPFHSFNNHERLDISQHDVLNRPCLVTVVGSKQH